MKRGITRRYKEAIGDYDRTRSRDGGRPQVREDERVWRLERVRHSRFRSQSALAAISSGENDLERCQGDSLLAIVNER